MFQGRSASLVSYHHSSACFSKKIGHFNELSYKMMEVVHAVVQEKPYKFSMFLMRDLESNMHTRQPFLIYPRFGTKVITR
ncbi:hypothetical protein Hanom_Chr12g01147961 [Helianthus anomalus]